jgi:hypothetical protein
LSALFFYLLAAHASMLRAAIRLMLDDVGYSCFISISQQTVSDALHEVGNRSLEPAKVDTINTYIKYPNNLEALRSVRHK